MTASKDHRLATRALHAGQEPAPGTNAHAVPIYATAAYAFRDTDHAADLFALADVGNIYSRLMNPTVGVLEQRLAAMDGAAAGVGLASGQAAISGTLLTLARSGQNLLSSTSLYGGTYTLFSQTFPKLGIEVRFFDSDKPESIGKLADENTRAVYLESQGNPKNDVPDFEVVAAAAKDLAVPLVVDNTVMTPALFRPIEHGADIVVYSTTKYLGGHGVHVGGAMVDAGTFDFASDPDKWPQFARPDDAYHGVVFTDAAAAVAGGAAVALHLRTHWLRDTGGAMSPFAAFLFLLGVETVHLRMERHCRNAQRVAEWLSEHECVEWVNYPGLPDHPHHERSKRYMPDGAGGIVGFGIRGGKPAGEAFIDAVQLASHVANIGDAKTLVIHPASTTHQQLTEAQQRQTGVSPEYIRLCVGIEDVEDILADLDAALRQAAGGTA